MIPLPPQERTASRRPVKHDTLVQQPVAPASDAQHRSASKIAATWRGMVLRRHLATRAITLKFQHRKATIVQCFMRRCVAKRVVIGLREQREALVAQRQQGYLTVRLRELKAAITWQRAAFDAAATKVQRAYRWSCQRKATGSSEPMSDLHVPKRYLPDTWRRHRTQGFSGGMSVNPTSPTRPTVSNGVLVPAPPKSKSSGFAAESPLRALPLQSGSPNSDGRQLALFQSNKQLVLSPQPPQHKRFQGPPTQATVESINNKMRQREGELGALLETDAQQARIKERVEGIALQDMDHCAAVVQRRFRVNHAKQTVHSRQCLQEYHYRYATIIQSAFRSYIARNRATKHRKEIGADIWLATRKYGVAQVDRLKMEFVWNANVMTRAAITLQAAYRRYSYLSRYSAEVHGAYATYLSGGPKALPLGLLRECSAYKTAVEAVRHEDFRRPKYMLRRHRDVQARKLMAEQKRKEQEARAAQEAAAAAQEAVAAAEEHVAPDNVGEREAADAEDAETPPPEANAVAPETEGAPAAEETETPAVGPETETSQPAEDDAVAPGNGSAVVEPPAPAEADGGAAAQPSSSIDEGTAVSNACSVDTTNRSLPDNAEAHYPEDDENEKVFRRLLPEEPEQAAAIRIQSMYRQHAARATVRVRREAQESAFEQSMQEEAAKTIQAAHRRRKSPQTTSMEGSHRRSPQTRVLPETPRSDQMEL